MTKRTFTFDGWQQIMDALSPEEADLELKILERCEESENEDFIEVEMTEDEAAVVASMAKELFAIE